MGDAHVPRAWLERERMKYEDLASRVWAYRPLLKYRESNLLLVMELIDKRRQIKEMKKMLIRMERQLTAEKETLRRRVVELEYMLGSKKRDKAQREDPEAFVHELRQYAARSYPQSDFSISQAESARQETPMTSVIKARDEDVAALLGIESSERFDNTIGQDTLSIINRISPT